MKAQKLVLDGSEFFLIINEETRELTLYTDTGEKRSLPLPKTPLPKTLINYWELFGMLTPKDEDDDPLYDADIDQIDEDIDQELMRFLGIEFYEFNIAEDYLSAIFYDDTTGLEENDEKLLNQWINSLSLPTGHWSVNNNEESSFSRCEVTGLMADCVSLLWVVMK